jgi:hypothetical protein
MPRGSDIRVKTKLAGPLMRMIGQQIPLSEGTLNKMGEALVEGIAAEAERDRILAGPRAPGAPVGIPDTPTFKDSFSYKIRGKRTIDIISSWPWIEQITEGRAPYKMTWLTRANKVHAVPIMTKDGTVIVRTAPLRTKDAWIHPGFARHTFIERGIDRARPKIEELLLAELAHALGKP